MITWMQRHRKYLVVTMWISAIAFVGAGFVGWGQYSYGEKATAVAKVGNVDISMRELQQSYSRLYSQYNKMFQGNFDEIKQKVENEKVAIYLSKKPKLWFNGEWYDGVPYKIKKRWWRK